MTCQLEHSSEFAVRFKSHNDCIFFLWPHCINFTRTLIKHYIIITTNQFQIHPMEIGFSITVPWSLSNYTFPLKFILIAHFRLYNIIVMCIITDAIWWYGEIYTANCFINHGFQISAVVEFFSVNPIANIGFLGRGTNEANWSGH